MFGWQLCGTKRTSRFLLRIAAFSQRPACSGLRADQILLSEFLELAIFSRQSVYNGGLWIGAPFGEPGTGYPRLMTLLRHTVDIRH